MYKKLTFDKIQHNFINITDMTLKFGYDLAVDIRNTQPWLIACVATMSGTQRHQAAGHASRESSQGEQ